MKQLEEEIYNCEMNSNCKKNREKSATIFINSKILFPVLIIISVCVMAIGYGAINTSLSIGGSVQANGQSGIYITSVEKTASSNATDEVSYYVSNILNTNVVLSSTSSYVTYTVSIINTNSEDYYFREVNTGSYTSSKLDITLEDLAVGQKLEAGGNVTFTVKLSYPDGESVTASELTAYLQFEFIKPETWKYVDGSNDMQITNGIVTLTIGDYVYYDAVKGASTTEVISYQSANGYLDQTFALEDSGDSYSWQVMGLDESTGEILLVMEDYILTKDNQNYYLLGGTAYANAVSELNNICYKLFSQGTGASSARSIAIEDINKLVGFDPEDIDGNGTPYGDGTLYEYGNKVSYYWKGKETPYYSAGNNVYGYLNTSHKDEGFYWFENGEWQTSAYSTEEKYITTITNVYYAYEKADYPSTLVYLSTGSYWLGSSYMYTNTDTVDFGVYYVSETLCERRLFRRV